jgi:hypothetical protein
MPKIDIPHFGSIDPFSVEEEYNESFQFRGKEVLLDLHFEAQWISPDKLKTVKDMLDDLVFIEAKNRQRLRRDFGATSDNTVKYYLEFLQEKIWRSALEELVDFTNGSITPVEQLFASLHLVRIGFYPDNEDVFSVFDYSIGDDYTEYVIAMNCTQAGELQMMTMEL